MSGIGKVWSDTKRAVKNWGIRHGWVKADPPKTPTYRSYSSANDRTQLHRDVSKAAAEKYFEGKIDNTPGCVKSAMSGYAKEVYNKSLEELNASELENVYKVAQSYTDGIGGMNPPCNELNDVYMEYAKKFWKQE